MPSPQPPGSRRRNTTSCVSSARRGGAAFRSDLTRLVSGLAHAKLVMRGTDADDRRRSTNRITPAGRTLLGRLDRAVTHAAKQTLGHLGRARLTALRDLLIAFAPPQTSDPQ